MLHHHVSGYKTGFHLQTTAILRLNYHEHLPFSMFLQAACTYSCTIVASRVAKLAAVKFSRLDLISDQSGYF